MTTQPARRNNLWHNLWSLAAGERLLAVVLLSLAICLAFLLAIPQIPPTLPAASRWLAQVQARFGPTMGPLNALGFFSMGRSPLFRLFLSLLTFLLLVRAVERAERLRSGKQVTGGGEKWQPLADDDLKQATQKLRRGGYRVRRTPGGDVLQADRWPWAETLAFLAHLGPLLLLLGLLVGTVWGWRVEHLTGKPGETIAVPGQGEITVVDMPTGSGVDPSGVRLYLEGTGPELTIAATNAAGEPLGLLQTPEAEPSHQLQLRLTDTATDAYFAIPQAELFVRIALEPEAPLAAETPLLVQVFRIRSGELVQEVVVTGDTDLLRGETDSQLIRTHYLVLTAARDPGYWLKVTGLMIAGLALLGRALWPRRRLWVRKNGSQLVGSGDLPRRLTKAAGDRPRRDHGRAALRLLVGLLAPAVGGAALWSLIQSGMLWDGSAIQAGLTALWMVGAAAGLTWCDGAAGTGD